MVGRYSDSSLKSWFKDTENVGFFVCRTGFQSAQWRGWDSAYHLVLFLSPWRNFFSIFLAPQVEYVIAQFPGFC